jgi:hypothetical protein
MELLIPGLIIVALMAYASTRIKRSAAAAFEPETIETEELIIQKPQGFLNNLNGDPKYLVDTYSQDNGVAASNTRAGSLRISKVPGSVEDAIASIRASDGEIMDDIGEVIGGRHYRVIETHRTEKTTDCIVTYKLAERDGNIYQLEAVRLAEMSDEFAGKMDAFVASFELK